MDIFVEVYENKAYPLITEMSNGTPRQETVNTQVTYDTPDTGYGASTTGTIYGIYDMSGGASEYVMGNYNNVLGGSIENSGFCGTNGPTSGCVEWPESKYYDLYTSDVSSEAYKFVDATYETNGWYGYGIYFVNSSYPWFTRAAVFSKDANVGHAFYYFSSRFSIKP